MVLMARELLQPSWFRWIRPRKSLVFLIVSERFFFPPLPVASPAFFVGVTAVPVALV